MAYIDHVLSKGASLYLPLTETSGTAAFDRSGNGLNGEYILSPTLGAVGPIVGDSDNRAVTLNGTTQYITVADNALLDFPNPDIFTLEAWINPTVLTTQGILIRVATGSYDLRINSSGLLAFAKHNVATVVASTITPTANIWNHVIVTKSGATTKLYINGVDRTGTVTNQTIVAAAVALNVGGMSGAFLNGSIAHAALYPTALTAEQVLDNFTSGESTEILNSQHRMYLKGHKNRYDVVDE